MLQEHIEKQPGVQPPVPWWAKLMIARRADFASSAVGVKTADDDHPERLFIFCFGCQQPYYSYFEVAVRSDLAPEDLTRPVPAPHPTDAFVLHYFLPFEFLHPCNVPIEASTAEIHLYTNVCYRGSHISTDHGVPFDEFVSSLPPLPGRRRRHDAAATRRVPKDVRDALMLEFKWLTPEDCGILSSGNTGPGTPFGKHGHATPKPSDHPGGYEDGGDPDDDDDDEPGGDHDDGETQDMHDVHDICDALRAHREAWAEESDRYGLDYYVRPISGAYVFKKDGVLSNGVACFPRSHVSLFERLFAVPATKTFAYLEHSEHGAHMLARAWASRLQFYYGIWVEHGSSASMDFSGDEFNFDDSDEFLDWACTVPLDSWTFDCVTLVRNFKPVPR